MVTNLPGSLQKRNIFFSFGFCPYINFYTNVRMLHFFKCLDFLLSKSGFLFVLSKATFYTFHEITPTVEVQEKTPICSFLASQKVSTVQP